MKGSVNSSDHQHQGKTFPMSQGLLLCATDEKTEVQRVEITQVARIRFKTQLRTGLLLSSLDHTTSQEGICAKEEYVKDLRERGF